MLLDMVPQSNWCSWNTEVAHGGEPGNVQGVVAEMRRWLERKRVRRGRAAHSQVPQSDIGVMARIWDAKASGQTTTSP